MKQEIDMIVLINSLEMNGHKKTNLEQASKAAEEILMFIPNNTYKETFWPAIWIRTCRVIYKLDLIDCLKKIAISPKPHYLSALGALILAKNGFFEGSVKDWLMSTRDYPYLTFKEAKSLKKVLIKLNNFEKEISYLDSLKFDDNSNQ